MALDIQGEVYAVPRMTGKRTKAVRERLGDPETLPSVADTQDRIGKLRATTLKRHIDALDIRLTEKLAPLRQQKAKQRMDQRAARAKLEDAQKERWTQEATARQARFSRGLRGMWDWLRGHHRAIRKRNEAEIVFKRDRDRAERQALISEHLKDRRTLETQIKQHRRKYGRDLARLHRDLANSFQPPNRSFTRTGGGREKQRERGDATRSRTPSRGAGRSRERTLEP